MSGIGRTAIVHVRGTSGNLTDVTGGNAFKVDGSFRRKIGLGKFQLSTTQYTVLPNCPCSYVSVRSFEGNDLVWIGGSDKYLVDAGIETFILETELRSFPVNNANELSLLATTEYNEVVVDAYSNEDVDVQRSDPVPPDQTSPTVASYFPTPTGITNVERNTSIYAIFSEELHDDCILNANITIAPAISYTVSKDSVDPLKIIILPSAQLAASTAYTITLTTNLKDKAKIPNFLAAPFVFTFTTKAIPPPPDTTAPTVISTTPADNAINALLTVAPSISFSEDLNDATVSTTTIKVFKDTTNTALTVASLTHSTDGKTVSITLSGSLEYSTKYRVELGTGIKDLAGNALATAFIFRFTTAAQQLDTVWTLTGNTELKLYSGNYTGMIAFVKTNQSLLYNRKIKEWTFEACKSGAAPGNITVVVLDASDNVKHTFSESLSAATLTTSFLQYTLHSPSNEIVMAVNYKIGIIYSSGSSSAYVKVKYANNSTYNSTHTILRIPYIFGMNLDYDDADATGTMKALPL